MTIYYVYCIILILIVFRSKLQVILAVITMSSVEDTPPLPKSREMSDEQTQLALNMAAGVIVSAFGLLTLDYTFFNLLPGFLSGLGPILAFLMLMNQSRAVSRITSIREFRLLFFALLLGFTYTFVTYIAIDVFSIEFEVYQTSVIKILLNIILASIILPWFWFTVRLTKNRILVVIFLFTLFLVYPGVLIAQFDSVGFANEGLYFAIFYVSLWLIIAMLQSRIFHPTKRTQIAKTIFVAAFVGLGFPFYLLLVNQTLPVLVLSKIGLFTWLFGMMGVLTFYSEGLIMTKSQTLSAAKAFNEMKSHEIEECLVYDRLDNYFKTMPEELVLSTEDEELTLIWIGEQRRTTE